MLLEIADIATDNTYGAPVGTLATHEDIFEFFFDPR